MGEWQTLLNYRRVEIFLCGELPLPNSVIQFHRSRSRSSSGARYLTTPEVHHRGTEAQDERITWGLRKHSRIRDSFRESGSLRILSPIRVHPRYPWFNTGVLQPFGAIELRFQGWGVQGYHGFGRRGGHGLHIRPHPQIRRALQGQAKSLAGGDHQLHS
jgi:hypothetical protein